MELNFYISNLTFYIEEDICYLKDNNNFLLNFNTNQITKLDITLNEIIVYIDLDLVIRIKK